MPQRPLSSIYVNPTEDFRGSANDESRSVLENWWLSDRSVVDPQRDTWTEVYNMYRGLMDIDDDGLMSNFHVPDTWAHIEAYVPRVAAARPRIEVWEVEPSDIDLARMHRALIFYDWRKLRIPFWIVPFVKAGLVFGTSAWRIRHRKEVGRVSVRQTSSLESLRYRMIEQFRGLPPGTMEAPLRFTDVEKTIYDDPVLEPMDLDRLYPHPDGTSIEDIELRNLWLIDEQPGVEFSQIEAESEAGDSFDPAVVRSLGKLVENANPYARFSSEHRQYLKDRQLQDFGPQQSAEADPRLRQVTLLRQQTRHQIKVVVKEFPELPPLLSRTNRLGMIDVSIFTPIPDPMYSFYGQSLAEILFSPNLEKDALHNARMDRILASIYPMFGVLRGQGPAPSQIRWRPWGTVTMDGPNDLWPLELPQLNLAAYRESAEIDQSMQKAAAADQFIGIGGPGAETATESSMLYQSAGTKAGLMYHILSAQTLERVGRLLIAINQLYKSRDQIVRLTGAAAVDIDASRLSEGFTSEPDLILDVAQTEPMTRQFRLQRAINALQTAGSIPPEAWQIPIVMELGKKVLEGLDFEHLEGVVEQMASGVPASSLAQQLTDGSGRATSTNSTTRPETEGDRLAQDSGGNQGPLPS